MNQYDDRNRSRNSSRTGGRSASRGSSSGYSGPRGSRSRGASQNRKSPNRKRPPQRNYKWIAIGGVILILVICAAVFAVKGMKGKTQEEPSSETETQLEKEVSVDGVSIAGMSREEAHDVLLKNYTWTMNVSYGEDSYEIPNLMEDKVNALLQEIFSGEPKDSYSLDTSGMEESVKTHVEAMAKKWDKPAKNGEISSFDKEKKAFVYSGEENGIVIDQEKLASDINQAIQSKNFEAQLTAEAKEVVPEITEAQAKEMYQVIGQFSTTTTANVARNTNIKLAAECLEGKIIQPGETFSFNETTGERSEAKGYKPAGAYVDGKLVEEPGGGVCQVSSTLYNAVIFAGLNTTERRAHSYEPSYVTPGEDAAVSYGGPDMKFINTSNTAIALRAKLEGGTSSKMKLTISVVGIPILEDGVTVSMHSEKVSELDQPAPTYEEDQTLAPGEEKIVKQGDKGSVWSTNLVKKKNGEVISDEFFHRSTYMGHAAVIKRNTSGVQITTEGESVTGDGTETTDQTIAGSDEAPTAESGSQTSSQQPGEGSQQPTGTAEKTEGPDSSSQGPADSQGQQTSPGTNTSQPNVVTPNPSGNENSGSVPAGPGV